MNARMDRPGVMSTTSSKSSAPSSASEITCRRSPTERASFFTAHSVGASRARQARARRVHSESAWRPACEKFEIDRGFDVKRDPALGRRGGSAAATGRTGRRAPSPEAPRTRPGHTCAHVRMCVSASACARRFLAVREAQKFEARQSARIADRLDYLCMCVCACECACVRECVRVNGCMCADVCVGIYSNHLCYVSNIAQLRVDLLRKTTPHQRMQHHSLALCAPESRTFWCFGVVGPDSTKCTVDPGRLTKLANRSHRTHTQPMHL